MLYSYEKHVNVVVEFRTTHQNTNENMYLTRTQVSPPISYFW